jgi:hypothetical protein
MSKVVSFNYEYALISDPANVTTLAPYQTTLEQFIIDVAATAQNGFGRYDFATLANSTIGAPCPAFPPGATIYLYNSAAATQVNSTGQVVMPCVFLPSASITPGAAATQQAFFANAGQIIMVPGAWTASSPTNMAYLQVATTGITGNPAPAFTVGDINTATTPMSGTVFWTY